MDVPQWNQIHTDNNAATEIVTVSQKVQKCSVISSFSLMYGKAIRHQRELDSEHRQLTVPVSELRNVRICL